MSGLDITFAAAGGAGIISFLSPCVLPLVPAYLCFVAGTSLDQVIEDGAVERAMGRRVAMAALAFVLGRLGREFSRSEAQGIAKGSARDTADSIAEIILNGLASR